MKKVTKKDLILQSLEKGLGVKATAAVVGCSENYVTNVRSKGWPAAMDDPTPTKRRKKAPQKSPAAASVSAPIGLRERIVRGRRIVSVEFDLGPAAQ